MNDALLPGEKLLVTRPANLLFGFEDPKIPEGRVPIGPFSALATTLPVVLKALTVAAKMRAIGGKVHVTTYRVFFASHRLNTTRGTCSVFLPTIVFDEAVTGPISGHWVLRTMLSTHRLVVRDPKELSQLMRQTKEKPLELAALREHVSANLEKVGQGIGPFWNRKDLPKALESKEANSLQAVALVNALELFVD